jgi:sugar phosphate isomerase/epimerase
MAINQERGRGRLSSIDLLPDEAQPDIVWAGEELRKRDRLQKDILAEFNARLADRGIGPVSVGAFSRYSTQLSITTRRIEETHRIVKALGARLDAASSDDLTMMVAELGKTLVFELLQGAGESGFTPKDAKELAMAARSFAQAQRASTDRIVALEKEMEGKVEAVTTAMAKQTGLSAEQVAKIRRDVLGVRE